MTRVVRFRTKLDRELDALGIEYPRDESGLPPPKDAEEVLAREIEALQLQHGGPPEAVLPDEGGNERD